MVENVMQIKSVITIIVNASIKIWKKMMCEKKIILQNPAASSCKKGKYLAGIIDDSVITSDEITEKTTNPTETVLTKSTSTYFCYVLAFLLITSALLISVSIYCYLIKYKAKQKHLLP